MLLKCELHSTFGLTTLGKTRLWNNFGTFFAVRKKLTSNFSALLVYFASIFALTMPNKQKTHSVKQLAAMYLMMFRINQEYRVKALLEVQKGEEDDFYRPKSKILRRYKNHCRKIESIIQRGLDRSPSIDLKKLGVIQDDSDIELPKRSHTIFVQEQRLIEILSTVTEQEVTPAPLSQADDSVQTTPPLSQPLKRSLRLAGLQLTDTVFDVNPDKIIKNPGPIRPRCLQIGCNILPTWVFRGSKPQNSNVCYMHKLEGMVNAFPDFVVYEVPQNFEATLSLENETTMSASPDYFSSPLFASSSPTASDIALFKTIGEAQETDEESDGEEYVDYFLLESNAIDPNGKLCSCGRIECGGCGRGW